MSTRTVEPDIESNEMPEEPERRGLHARWASPRFRYAVFGVLALIVVVALLVYLHYRNRVSTDDAQVDGHVTPVSSKIYGMVAEVLVNDNQQVNAGQVLAKIDPRDYQSKVDQEKAALQLAENQARAASVGVPWTRETTTSGESGASAQLSAAQADDARARADYDKAAGPDLEVARSNVAMRQATYDKAEADLARMKPLADKEEISKQQYDAFVETARVAESGLRAARDQVNAAQNEIAIRKAALGAAQARVAQARAGVESSRANTRQVQISSAQAASAGSSVERARANLDAAQLQLSYTTITSPIAGVVTRKSVEVGQVVQPGQGLMVIIPLQNVWVTANFKETDLADVHPGQRAEVQVDMYGKTFSGRVDSIAGATGSKLSLLPPENATGNFVKVVQRIPVKIVLDPIPPNEAVLRPGMNVVATIMTK